MIWGELFAGIRGFGLGLEAAGHSTAWAADIEPFCQELMALRAPGLEVLGDVRLIDAGAPKVHGLAGGFPCQPVSAAGKGLAQADERWLWPEFYRVICALNPAVVLIENVPMLRKRGMIDVLRDLCEAGYFVSWDGIPAAAVGAPHLRDRVWIVARRVRYPVFGEPTAMLPMANVLQDGWKIPRAGFMDTGGGVFECEPLAPVKTTRRDGWSYWTGVQLGVGVGQRPLLPTPMAGDAVKGSSTMYRGAPLWPTPTTADGSGGPGSSGRDGGDNLRTAVQGAPERGPLNPSWVESSLMGFPLGWTDITEQRPGRELEMVHAAATAVLGAEALSVVRDDVREAAALVREAGGRGVLPPTEVLLSVLRELARGGDGGRLPGASAEVHRGELRSVRLAGAPARSPRRSGRDAQLGGEHPDLVRLVSRLLALDGREGGAAGRRPDAFSLAEAVGPRVLRDVPNRKARLQACGNALLPQIPALIGAALAGTAIRSGGNGGGALHPTPVARDWKGQGMASQLGTNAALGLWPPEEGA